MAANVDSDCKKRSPIFKKESRKISEDGGTTNNYDDKYEKKKNGVLLNWEDGTVRRPRCNGLAHEVPEFQRVPLIETGYRVDYIGTRELASTLCKCHNDTVNIWTHLIGSAVLFVFTIIFLVLQENHSSIAQIGCN